MWGSANPASGPASDPESARAMRRALDAWLETHPVAPREHNPLPEILHRAQRIRRRRRVLRAAVVAVATVVVALTQPWRAGTTPTAGDAAAMVEVAGLNAAAAAVTPAADGPGSSPVRPADALPWRPRGARRVPAALVAAARGAIAQAESADPDAVTLSVLYAAQPTAFGRDWLMVAEAWPDRGAAGPTLIAAFRAGPDGRRARPVTAIAPLRFTHGDPTTNATANATGDSATDRIAVYTVAVDRPGRLVLALGAPGTVHAIGYAADGVTFAPVSDPAEPDLALFTRAASVPADRPDLVQARDAAGRLLTGPDAGSLAGAARRRAPATPGWTLPDLTAPDA